MSEGTPIEEVAQKFGKAHYEEAKQKKLKESLREQFFDLIEIPEDDLATQSIFYEGEDPEGHVATLYPKWRILKKALLDDGEWKIIIQEDPEKKTFVFVNPLDRKVYQRVYAEKAPQLDLERLKAENPHLWTKVTFQPPPPERELKPLDDLTQEQKDALLPFLVAPELTATMKAPRKAKAEELESLG